MGLDKLLRQEEVALAVGCSRGHVWRMVSQRRFPPPYRTGKRAVRWKASEVEVWIDNLAVKQVAG